MPRTLIAGFGNVLRCDDGFGVEAVRRLEAAGALGPDVRVLEIGIGGLQLVQELLSGYDQLIIVDAMARGGPPGTVYVLEVQGVPTDAPIDAHLTVPSRALTLAQALGILPGRTFLVGCEPAEVDELDLRLTPPVQQAMDVVLQRVYSLVAQDCPDNMQGQTT